MIPHTGYITFASTLPKLSVKVLAGEGNVTTQGGYGNWEVISRPRRLGITSWLGFDPMRISMPILFDAFSESDPSGEPTGEAVETQINALERMAGRGKGSKTTEQPPAVKLNAPGSLDPYPGIDSWVIEGIEWGDAALNSKGLRIRQHATVNLMQRVTDKVLQERSVANRRRKTNAHPPRKYKVKKGDTLMKIARNEYGTTDMWQEIKKANRKKIQANGGKIKQGMILTLPRQDKDK